MAIVTNYNYSQFNLEKAKSGSLCAIVSKSLSAPSGTIKIEDTEDVCVSFTPNASTADYKGKGICRVIGSGSLCITIGGVDYIFNNVGLGTGSNSIFYKLVILTIATSIPTRGERVTRGISDGSQADANINITGMSARDEFASQALKGLMARVDDPSTLSDSEINYYCSTAYRWASLMMLTAANVRDAVGQESSSNPAHVDVQSLDSNVERLLNNIAVAISNGGIGGGTISGDVSVKNATNTTFTTIFGNSGLGSSANNPLFISMPGYLKTSDIADWAKAATKPTYSFSELTSYPTTISGYGITDANIQNGTITLGSNSITPISNIGLATPTGLLVNGTSSATLTSNGTFTLAYDTNNGYIPFTNTYKLLIEKLASWFNEDANGDIYVQNRPNGGDPRGFYSNSFISALGASSASGGGGGTGVSLNEPLATINNLSPVPTTAGTALMWNGSTYTWGNPTAATHYHDNRYYISGNTIHLGNSSITPLISEQYLGTVTSVAMTVPTGFSITGTPITSSGTLALSFASGYSLPTSAKQSNWDTAYSQTHTHSNKSVLDGITATKVSNWDGAVSDANTLKGYFNSNGVAKSAAKLTTVSKTAWGQTYWTSGGVPTSISGNMSDVGYIYLTEPEGDLGEDPAIFLDQDGINIRSFDTNYALYVYGGDTYLAQKLSISGFVTEKDENNRLKFNGNVYATGAVSALGVSAAGGSVTGAVYLNDLQDVDTAGAANGKVLTYSNGGWVAQNPPTPSLSGYATQTWANGKFVTAVGVTGNQLYYTLNGANSTFTVPYALSAGTLDVQAMANRTSPDSLSGTKAFSCDNLLTANDGYDYAGLQVGYTYDKWQLTALSGHLYIRQNDGGTWTDWNKIWDNSSVGSGSGLDADLLDGTHKADLFTALTSSAATPLSVTIGGTTKSLSTLYATRLSGSSTYKAWGQTYWENGVPKGNVKDTLYMLSSESGVSVNSNSAKLKFNSYDADGTDVRRSPYIQAIYEASYGRKRLSVFQSNAASWGSDFVETFTILPNGNVGIGTTAPSQKLHVVGNIMATGAVSALGTSAAGTTGTSLATLSDVYISSTPTTGTALVYNANNNRWEPGATSGYLPLSGGTMTGGIALQSNLSTANYPSIRGHAIGVNALLSQHGTGDNGYRGGLYFMYGRVSNSSQDVLQSISLTCLSEYKSDPWNGAYGLQITSDDITWKGNSLPTVKTISDYAGDNFADVLKGYSGTFFFQGNYLKDGQFDWVGLQIGSNADKGQILFEDGTLVVRQNDSGGTNTTGWSTWKKLASVSDLEGYLPLTAGSSKPLTGSLYQVNGAGLFIKDTDGTGRMAVFMNNQNQFFVGFGMRQGGYEGYFDSNIIYLRTGSTGTTMTLDASHNVGIGTTTPAYKLDVNGDIHTSSDIRLDSEHVIYFKDSANPSRWCDALSHSYDTNLEKDVLYVGFDFSGADHATEIYGRTLTLYGGSGSNKYLKINANGNVGIAVEPSYKLDVDGTGHFVGDSNSKYGIILDNDQAITLKDNAANLHRALFLNNSNLLSLGYGTTKSGGYNTEICGNSITFKTGRDSNNQNEPIDHNIKINAVGQLQIGDGYIEWDATNRMLKFSGGNGIYAVGAVSALGITGDLNGQITRPLTFNDDITLGTYLDSTNTKSYKINFGSSGPYLQRNNSNIVASVTGGAFSVSGNLGVVGTLGVTGAAIFNNTVSLTKDTSITQGYGIKFANSENYKILKDSGAYITIKGATKFTEAVTMGSTLTVNSTSTLKGNTTISDANKMIFGDSDNYIHRKATTIQGNTTYSLHLSGNEIDVDAGSGSIYFSGIAEFDNSVSVSGSIDIGDGEQIQFGTKGYLYTSGNNIYWHNNAANTNTKLA